MNFNVQFGAINKMARWFTWQHTHLLMN